MKPSARTSAIDEFAVPADALLDQLKTSSCGLTSEQAKELSARLGANRLHARRGAPGFALLLRQFTNPIVLILMGAAALSAFLRDGTDAAIIIAIVIGSGLLGFWQEHTAANAVARLTAVVATKVRVLRDGLEVLLPLEEIVPGDVVIFCAGALVPADCRLLETRDLFVNEAALTGETYPVEKNPGSLINLLTDLPEMTIAGDNVDPELVQAPRRWDIKFIRKFMLVFGTLSSVFDCLTFALLLWLGATMAQFRTGWFIESIVSASLIVLVVRSRRPFFQSRPSKLLTIATAAIVVAAFLVPHLAFAPLLGFAPMPAHFYPIIVLIVIAYMASAEITKRMFYRDRRDSRSNRGQ